MDQKESNGGVKESESIVVHTESEEEDTSVERIKDPSCFLCSVLENKSTDEKLTDKEYHYAFGFAMGVVTALRSEGPYHCDLHREVVKRALNAQGVNWGDTK